MKRLSYFVLLLILGLTACSVTITPNEVTIATNDQTVAPGAAVTLNASANFDTRIVWSVSSNDGRSPKDAFSKEGVGENVVYTAPQDDGVYTIVASAIDSVSIRDTVKITVDSFLGLDPVDAGTDFDAAAAAGSIAPGEEKLFLVNVSNDTAAAGAALYLELDAALNLTVLDDDRSVYATSSSAEVFAAGTAGLESRGLAPQTISNVRKCRGACVIQDASAGNYYLRVENTSGDTVNYALYAYVTDYSDDNEAVNDAAATAVSLGDFDNGALESLGDEDYYVASKNGKLCFGGTSWSNARVNVTNIDGLDQTLEPGGSISLRADDVIRVYEPGGDAAAAASVSKYVLEILPSGSSCG